MEERVFKRGDIYLADLGPCDGHRQAGIRPVILLQNNVGNYYCPTLIIVPLTSQLKKLYMPTHYVLKDVDGLEKPAMVIGEQPGTINKTQIIKYMGHLDRTDMDAVMRCIENSIKDINT